MSQNDLKYLALYLPQFHTFPENDEWWGHGFTEWTNTRAAQPYFDGHYQPHIPHDDIGYYDLSDVDVMVRQAQMAKQYGIYGFCYYYYWFNGRKLMEKPLKNMLNNPDVNIPFCLFWANHNFTRSWDAGNTEILLEQTYTTESYKKFIDDLMPYFNDPRYIRIDNKPMLLVYQCDHMQDPENAVKIWRQYARDKYNTELYLITIQQNNNIAPSVFGYDAALETAPNFRAIKCLLPESMRPKISDDVELTFYDYLTDAMLHILRPRERYKLFKCVYPMWDNTARRKKKKGWMFYGATPELFKKFLAEISYKTIQEFDSDQRFVFINAWNEWAEGTHLEPDKKYGYEILNICRDVANMSTNELKKNCFDYRLKYKMCNKLYGSFIKRILKKLNPIHKVRNGNNRMLYVGHVLIFQYKKH